MDNWLRVFLFAILAYVTLFIIAKLLGKKQIAELDFIDYVTGISIGSIAAEMATETEQPIYYYLIAMVVFFVFDFAITLLARKTNFLKHFLRGTPLILINKGEIDYKQLKKSKIDFYDLLGMARDKGYFNLNEIEYAIFETNGDLSILPKDEFRQVKRQDFDNIPTKKVSLTNYIIVDGQISNFALKQIGKSKIWLKQVLKKQNISLKNVLYAIYNDKTKKVHFSLKNK